MKNIINKLRKYKLLLLLILVILIIIIVITIVINSNKNKTLECSKITNSIDGFTINDTLKVNINNNNKISEIIEDKNVQISGSYASQDKYEEIISNLFTNAYTYLPDDTYKITSLDNNVSIHIDTKENGVAIDNLTIDYNDPNNTSDVLMGITNSLSSAEHKITIGDEVSKDDEKKYLEGIGYQCK